METVKKSYLISDHDGDFMESQIEAGLFKNASEVIAEALRMLRAKQQSIELEETKALIEEAEEDIRAGRVVRITSAAQLIKLTER